MYDHGTSLGKISDWLQWAHPSPKSEAFLYHLAPPCKLDGSPGAHECCEHRGAGGGEQGKGFSVQGKSNMAEAKTRSSNDDLSCWLINSHHTDGCWEKSSSCAGGKDNLWGSWGQQMDRWGQGRPTLPWSLAEANASWWWNRAWAGGLQMLTRFLFQPLSDHMPPFLLSPMTYLIYFLFLFSFPLPETLFLLLRLEWAEPFCFSSFIFLPFYCSKHITDPSWTDPSVVISCLLEKGHYPATGSF